MWVIWAFALLPGAFFSSSFFHVSVRYFVNYLHGMQLKLWISSVHLTRLPCFSWLLTNLEQNDLCRCGTFSDLKTKTMLDDYTNLHEIHTSRLKHNVIRETGPFTTIYECSAFEWCKPDVNMVVYRHTHTEDEKRSMHHTSYHSVTPLWWLSASQTWQQTIHSSPSFPQWGCFLLPSLFCRLHPKWKKKKNNIQYKNEH